jgi:16S rRNA (uracil1498-N3)-methyltransferase
VLGTLTKTGLMRRVLVPAPLQAGPIELPRAEADHARTVLRMQAGDALQVMDGQGAVATATIIACDRKSVRVEAMAPERFPLAAAARLRCATAVPKGSKWDDMVRSLTELGVGVIQPVLWQRSVRASIRGERAQRAAQEAMKQCRRRGCQNCRMCAPCPNLLRRILRLWPRRHG